jgi:hypothetical protein
MRDRYDRSISRGRRRDDDEGYRSSRDYSRSRSGSRLRDDYFERSRSRSRSGGDYYRRQPMDERPLNIDSLIRRYEDLNIKTTQKTQERQLLFVAMAFFIGFIFAQGIIF